MKLQQILTSVLILASVSAWAAEGPVMYRFNNAAGDRVYSYTLPPGQAARGYDKVDLQSGRVVESVAPQLPPDQLAEKLAREQAMQACRDELDRIYQLYGKESDIELAEQQALESLDTRISQLQSNLHQARREQDRLEAQAADIERVGRQLPPVLVENMRRSQSQIDSLGTEIAQREEEQALASARFARELERFRDGRCPEGAATIAAP